MVQLRSCGVRSCTRISEARDHTRQVRAVTWPLKQGRACFRPAAVVRPAAAGRLLCHECDHALAADQRRCSWRTPARHAHVVSIECRLDDSRELADERCQVSSTSEGRRQDPGAPRARPVVTVDATSLVAWVFTTRAGFSPFRPILGVHPAASASGNVQPRQDLQDRCRTACRSERFPANGGARLGGERAQCACCGVE
jgi:hypothetical protein